MSRDLTKTLTYLALHLTVGFTVAYVMTGSLALAGGIALIEPAVNAVAFFFHERAWKAADARRAGEDSAARAIPVRMAGALGG